MTGESHRGEINRGIVQVEDLRVTELSRMYLPKKTVFASINFSDFAAAGSGAQMFSSEALQILKNCDALALVVRNFTDDILGDPSPVPEAEEMISELLLSDQILAEKRLERIDADMKRGKRSRELSAELAVMGKIHQHLDAGEPLRTLELLPDEEKIIAGVQFLTSKPLFAVLNSGEDSYRKSSSIVEELTNLCPVVEFCGAFEMELSEIDDDQDRREFMDDMGITESARQRLTTFAYRTLGYISFFTVGDDEVRAWTIRDGSSALDAAAAIHTDLARGFIRAEVFTYDDLMRFGSEKDVKTAGKFRLEGRQYTVQDGDILNIRFSV